ncbi:MAG TPA: DUF5320 domain-containing protein [Thermotogota bacterium]|nr:DUF5320 domain-containing protein [Thermotogota bacterium]HPJ90092.1 DUF5320 domain-containing protein [Thermotogota bacterium]HPR97286.1 DUF5320 domain-containing protein [Thermotogota bacterium]
MPGFNGRGPNGEGPMTGRGRGRCSQNFTEESTVVRKASEENGECVETDGFDRRNGYGNRRFQNEFPRRSCGRRMRRGCRR